MDTLVNTLALIHAVEVNTSARLHMGFFDLSGGDSKFGGLGLAIDAPCTQITIAKNQKRIIDVSLTDAKSSENVSNIVKNLVKVFNLKQHFSLTINQVIPMHAGLGSGTQLALSIGAGLNQLFDLQLGVSQIAAAAKRGVRSGIGIAAFKQGGFLVDAGKTGNHLPAIAMRQTFPTDWRVLLVQDSAHVGVHGAVESQAFKTLKPAPDSLRAMVFERMIPAMQCADLSAFGAYMADLQAYNGAYFAPIQGGCYASSDVAEVLTWLQENGVTCVGQSSWGPTGFAIVETVQEAERLQHQAQLVFATKRNISFNMVRGKNTGASISILES